MNCYKYVAKNLQGDKISGILDAKDEIQLITTLKEYGYYTLRYSHIKANNIKHILDISFTTRVSTKDIAIFCKQFSAIISAGINICEALNILSNQCKNHAIRKSLLVICNNVQKGEELSQALQGFKNIYPEFMIDMITIGEQSGTLDEVLKILWDYYIKQNILSRKIKDASYYPIFLLITTLIVCFFLMVKIVPMFIENLVSLNAKIPFITIVIIKISNFLSSNIAIILITIVVVIILGFLSKNTKAIKKSIDYLKLNTPKVNKLYRNILTARFARFMYILLHSGINIIKALDIMSHTIGNLIVEQRILIAIDDIKKGKTVSQSILNINIFEPLLISMVSIGEESGELDDMLLKTANIFEDDVYEDIEKLLTFIQPVMIIFLAIVIGTIIISIMLPMINMMDSIGN